MRSAEKYIGIYNDQHGGLTCAGKIVRNAWIFGLLPESESCVGWGAAEIERLWWQVDAVWENYDYLASNLPDELRKRFNRIHNEALERARADGWSGDSQLARAA